MFSGAYEHSVDAKGRTVIPARFSVKLGEEFILTKGVGGCLAIFPWDAWRRFYERLAPKSLLDAREIALQRYFLGSAVECSPDRQGRIAIPAHLLAHAGIQAGSAIWVVGLGDRIETWCKSRWEEFNAGLTDDVLTKLVLDAEVTELPESK